MLELRPNQICIKLSAAHLDDCRQWQAQIETEWRQAQQQRQASQSLDVSRLPIPRRGGAIGGAFTYTIRLIPDGYHLTVKDAISQAEREWITSNVCSRFDGLRRAARAGISVATSGVRSHRGRFV